MECALVHEAKCLTSANPSANPKYRDQGALTGSATLVCLGLFGRIFHIRMGRESLSKQLIVLGLT